MDVSHFQGTINWSAVAADPAKIVFGYAKASQGATVKDAQYKANYAGMRANGIIPGAYHFFDANVDVGLQVKNFLSMVPALQQGDLPPALDVEATDGMTGTQIFKGVQEWIAQVQAALGCTPVIYTSASFWNDNNITGNTNLFATSPLWVAQYTSAPAPNLPKGASVYTFWQYSQSGSVAGMTVDLDRFNGSMTQLSKMLHA